MDWRLRVDIPKRNQVFFFQDNVSWNFTGDDFLENRHGLTKRALQFGQIFCRGKFFANETNDLRAQNIASPRPYTRTDRKSTRLNSSHVSISYAVFCLKKKKNR